MAPCLADAQGFLIAPNAVIIDGRTKSGSVTLVNGGTESADVSLSTAYGYPSTDSLGTMFLKTFESVGDTMPSAAGWVRSFPQRLVMAPGERRTIRVLVSPPADLAVGEYWARLVVTTRTVPPAKRIARAGADTVPDVQIGLALEVRSLLALFYRNGPVNTGVDLGTPRTTVEGDSIIVRVAMHRRGNAAFVGSLHATIRDERGNTVGSEMLPLGVYYDLDPRIALKRPSLAAGKYTVTIDAVNTRPDVAPGLLLPIAPTQSLGDFRVAGSGR